MTIRFVSAPARPAGRAFATSIAALLLAVSAAHAQAPAPGAPKAKPAPRPAAPAPAPQAPQAPPQQQQQQGAVQMPPLIYSPWAKFCGKGQDPNAKQVCFTGKDARTESGVPVVAAALIEPDGEPQKIFRITLPSPLQLRYGTRLIIDQQQPPIAMPFFTCFSNGCMADYEGTPDLIGKLKKGQMLTIQAINLAGNEISFPLPLSDFAKANEGPPTDPKVFEEQQKKLQEELQKKAEEARKRLEQQGGAPK
ncbi:MAG TPA: invasion associated locus B family protein [Xanthobacteraceae bacterium]|nr:invasion associated locus B family protein [Xanthobacteraceae bacterium]